MHFAEFGVVMMLFLVGLEFTFLVYENLDIPLLDLVVYKLPYRH